VIECVSVRVMDCENEGGDSTDLLGYPGLPEVKDACNHQHGLCTKGLQWQTYQLISHLNHYLCNNIVQFCNQSPSVEMFIE